MKNKVIDFCDDLNRAMRKRKLFIQKTFQFLLEEG